MQPLDRAAASYAIITTRPNDLMAPIHNRMPVLLDRDDALVWLDPERTSPEEALHVLRPYAADEMEAYPVRALVSSVQNQGPELIEPMRTD
jgi:putative SOS response-associated peptidase YedK